MNSLFKLKFKMHRLVNIIFYLIIFILGFFVGFTINSVSAEEIETKNTHVVCRDSKNLFNEEYAKNSSNYAIFGTATSPGYNSIPIYLEPNTTYTFSRTDNDGLGLGYYCLLKLDGNTNASFDDTSKWIIHNTNSDYNNQKITFTTLDTGLVLFTVGYENNLTQNTLNNIWGVLKKFQIEQGSTANSYEPYGKQTCEIITSADNMFYYISKNIIGELDSKDFWVYDVVTCFLAISGLSILVVVVLSIFKFFVRG